MITLLKDITNSPGDINKLKSFLYDKNDWTQEDIDKLDDMYLGVNDLVDFTKSCIQAYSFLENDKLKKLISGDKPFTYREFDDAYKDFNEAMNFLLKNDIDPSKMKNGKIDFSKAQETYSNLNAELIRGYLERIKDFKKNMSDEEKAKVIEENEANRSQINQLQQLFNLSNGVHLVAKLDDEILGKIKKDRLRIIREKKFLAISQAKNELQNLSKNYVVPKQIYQRAKASLNNKREALENSNVKLQYQMLNEDDKQIMLKNLKNDKDIQRFNEILKDDAKKEAEINKNNKKIIMYKAADKIATSPITLYNKMKNFVSDRFQNTKEHYKNLNEKVENIKTKYQEKIMTEEQIEKISEESKKQRISELDPSLSSAKLSDAIDDAMSIFDQTFKKNQKANEKYKRTVKLIGNLQHLIKLPYDVINKIKSAKKEEESKGMSM